MQQTFVQLKCCKGSWEMKKIQEYEDNFSICVGLHCNVLDTPRVH